MKFFAIDTFGIEIPGFSPEFPDKVALAIKFFCIDPSGELFVQQSVYIKNERVMKSIQLTFGLFSFNE